MKDALFCGGGVAVLAGLALWSLAAALVAVGLAAIGGSVLWHLGEK